MVKKEETRFRHGLKIKNILDRQPTGRKSQFIRECILKRNKRMSSRWFCYHIIENIIKHIQDNVANGLIHESSLHYIIPKLNEILVRLELDL